MVHEQRESSSACLSHHKTTGNATWNRDNGNRGNVRRKEEEKKNIHETKQRAGNPMQEETQRKEEKQNIIQNLHITTLDPAIATSRGWGIPRSRYIGAVPPSTYCSRWRALRTARVR
ncbi:hypothetical protein PAXRUDRAFT_325825 [Paxillus rubicundulus Ve08.2h10]|uniref:Uncharacterized protein n=1 Tax=Paxillus rubicundulus Ve08.2h10 TaxID=930991 RepID=A0A0D0DZS1_9AGAM|nr:hypothetical protein PAXRUDRAFT_325825 [Paxillus rubicundulus Ve08.2h10]